MCWFAGLRAFVVTEGGRSPTGVTPNARKNFACRRRDRLRGEVSLTRRAPVKARVRTALVVELDLSRDRTPRLSATFLIEQRVHPDLATSGAELAADWSAKARQALER